jgi:hypothetical protein
MKNLTFNLKEVFVGWTAIVIVGAVLVSLLLFLLGNFVLGIIGIISGVIYGIIAGIAVIIGFMIHYYISQPIGKSIIRWRKKNGKN